jgi:hypothetical protein
MSECTTVVSALRAAHWTGTDPETIAAWFGGVEYSVVDDVLYLEMINGTAPLALDDVLVCRLIEDGWQPQNTLPHAAYLDRYSVIPEA